MPKKVILRYMARRIALSFVKNLYMFFILLACDPFDILERLGLSYKPPSWLIWVLLAVASGLAIWRTVEDTKKGIHNEEKLDSIKNTLITIDKYQRDAAIEQSKIALSNDVKARITQDFLTFYPISQIGFIFREAFERNNVDPLIDFYGKFGDILDANSCGLKLQLQNIRQYNEVLADLTSKSTALRLRRKRIELIQSNITRFLKGGYGLNSGIVLRSIFKTIHSQNKRGEAAMRSVIVGLEEMENIGREFLTYALGHLDTKWKPRFSPELLSTPQIQGMMGQVSKLNKKRFGVLHAFKDMLNRQGQN